MPFRMGRRRSRFRADLAAMWRFVSNLGGARDSLLVGLAVVYVLGYLFWSFHAATHGLGRLPALEAQYFVGGIVPALGLLLVGWTMVWMLRLQASMVDVAKRWPWLVRLLGLAGWECLLAFMVLLMLLPEEHSLVAFAFYGLGVTALLFIPVPQPAVMRQRMGDVALRLLHRYRRALWVVDVLFRRTYVVIVFLLLAGFLVVVYANTVFPRFSQAFGGVEERCAELDLEATSLSEESRARLLPTNATGDVVRSLPVMVYFDSGDSLLLKLRDASQRRDQTYEVQRSDIRSIHWGCERPAGPGGPGGLLP